MHSHNTVEMDKGTEIHIQQGRSVFEAGCLRYLGYGLMLMALVLAAIHFTVQIV